MTEPDLFTFQAHPDRDKSEPAADTQNGRLLAYLRGGRTVDPLTAWRQLGIYRLASRVCDLRQSGYPIATKNMKVRNRFGEEITVASYILEAGECGA